MTPRPPRVARALLARLLSPEDRAFVLGDLDEAFEARCRTHGVRAARRWYHRQTVHSVPPLVGSAFAEIATALPREVRQTARQLGRRPLYAAGMSGTLALGVASALALGGVAWSVWLRPLPYPDSEQLVRVWERGPTDSIGDRVRYPVSPPLLRELRTREWAHFTGFAGVLRSTPEWIVDDDIEQLRGLSVSPGFFELLGTTALAGRAGWSDSGEEPPPEVILTEPFWRQAFGGESSVVGSTIDLGGVRHTIVGVVPAFDGYPDAADVAVPLHFEARQLGEGMRGARYVEVVGRLRASSTVDSGAAEFAGFLEALGTEWASHAGWSGEAVTLRADLVGPFRSVLRLLLAAGAVFLALALVNVAGLGGARALERRGETAVRVALGASGTRRMRAALLEGGLLGAAGGGVALIGGGVLLRAATGWLPNDLPRTDALLPSPGQGLAVVLLATLLGAAVVALADRVVPTGSLLLSGVRTTTGHRARRGLVVGQLALTTVLLAAGAVAVERSITLAGRDVGFRSQGLWTGVIALPRSTTDGLEARRDRWTALLAALDERGLRAALSTNPPMTRSNSNYSFRRPGAEESAFAQYAIVSPSYFRLMDIPLRGRSFRPGDTGPVTVISEGLAEQYFPGENPVGMTLTILDEPHEIIGVAGSTAHFGPSVPEPPMMYVSYERVNWDFAKLLVEGKAGVGAEVAAALARSVPGARAPEGTPYEAHLSEWFRPLRIQVGIVGALALVGSLLAGLGLYSAVAFNLRGRMRELGIRVALGATGAHIVRGVVRGALGWAGAGLAAGFALWWLGRGALGAALGLESAAVTPAAAAATALAVLVLTVLAVAAPARRAASADPLESFRAN